MSEISKIARKLNEARKVEAELVQCICDEIDKLSQNRDITEIPGTTQAYTISKKDLSPDKVLTPFFYDFEAQKKAIKSLLQKSRSLESKIRSLWEIADKGQSEKNGLRFNPQVQALIHGIVRQCY
jgi:flagella basal body P-ring formation protein FlgA